MLKAPVAASASAVATKARWRRRGRGVRRGGRRRGTRPRRRRARRCCGARALHRERGDASARAGRDRRPRGSSPPASRSSSSARRRSSRASATQPRSLPHCVNSASCAKGHAAGGSDDETRKRLERADDRRPVVSDGARSSSGCLAARVPSAVVSDKEDDARRFDHARRVARALGRSARVASA